MSEDTTVAERESSPESGQQRMGTETLSIAIETVSLRGRIANGLERSSVPLLLVLLVVLFGTLPGTADLFLRPNNVQNILANQSVTALLAIGMVIPLVAGYFDLSVPAIAGLANVTMASLLATHQQPIWLGLVAGILVGVVAGVINGLLVAALRLDPLIVTLAMYVLFGGLLQLYTSGYVIIAGMPTSLGDWGAGQWLGLARPFWILIVIAVIVWFLMAQTPYGRKLAAIGSNEGAARLAGIPVDRAIFFTYVLSGLLGGIAGVMLTIRSGSGDPTSASNFLFPALAALFLGQTAITPGKPNVWGAVFGVFVVAVAVNGFSLLGADSWVNQVFNGGVLVVSVVASTLMSRARERRAKSLQMSALRG